MIYNYTVSTYPFPYLVSNIFELKGPLHNIHNELSHLINPSLRLSSPGKDQATEFHRIFYNKWEKGSNVGLCYRAFIREVVSLMSGFSTDHFIYQKVPTFRIHLPGDQAVGGISHRDSDYGHPKGEINFTLPITSMFGSNSMWMETSPGLKDFQFVSLNPGQCMMWNGRDLEHGNVPNTTGITRISLDFRILPLSLYNPEGYAKSIARGLRFVEGEYYALASNL